MRSASFMPGINLSNLWLSNSEPSPAKFQARPALASPQPYQACLKLDPLRLRLKHIKLASSASAT
jgi:hypothetical protein